MEEVRIVECGVADAGELAEIGRATFLDTYSAETSPDHMRDFLSDAYRPETVRAELAVQGSRFYIARIGHAAAGYLKLNTGDAQGEQLDGVGLEIEAIYVRRHYQGMGIGSRMLAHARAEAEAIGADHIWLAVWERNRTAIQFYKQSGFIVVGSHPFAFGSVEHTDLIMRRELGRPATHGRASDRVALKAALEAQVDEGAPGALARIDAPDVGLIWSGATGRLARGSGRRLHADDHFRVASVTKSVTAAVAVRLARDGLLAVDEPLDNQLPRDLLHRWRALRTLPRATPRQLLAHTSGLPDYFREEAFAARLREEPGRAWQPVELIDHAAALGRPLFPPGEGFSYSDTGYVVVGLLVEQATGLPLHSVYRKLVFDPLGMNATWLEGHEAARATEIAHHYHDELDLTTVTPTIDWAGGGLVTTAPDLVRFVRGLWSGRVVGYGGIEELTRWTPGVSFPPGHAVRYDEYGLGIGRILVEGVELVGHTGFIGAFAFHAREYDAVLVGTHNASEVDRWPLVAALCRELRTAASE